jgi:hypothetical protein
MTATADLGSAAGAKGGYGAGSPIAKNEGIPTRGAQQAGTNREPHPPPQPHQRTMVTTSDRNAGVASLSHTVRFGTHGNITHRN